MENETESRTALVTEGASTALAAVDAMAPSGWRLKLAKATAQLLVGTRAGAAVYAEAREHLDEIEGRSAMNKQLYAIAAQQVLNDPDEIERAKARLVNNSIRKQANLEAVVSGAMPSPPLLEYSSDEDPDRRADSDAKDDDEPLDPDWASTFSGIAEDADSDHLRERLSKVLRGELKKRGSFPRSVLRAIAELDKADLDALLSVAHHVRFNYVAPEANLSPVLTQLLEAQLIHDSAARTYTRKIVADAGQVGGLVGLKYGITVGSTAPVEFTIKGTPLTRLGGAVLSLLDSYDEKAIITDFCAALSKDNLSFIALGVAVDLGGLKFRLIDPQVIYSAPGTGGAAVV